MLKTLMNNSKSTEEDFLKELLNLNTNNEKLNKLYKDFNTDLNQLYYQDEHIFHLCCKKDLFHSVVWLISNGINLEIENLEKETAIFYAIRTKGTVILQIFVENGANINHLNIFNRTALQEAVIRANNRIVNYLLQITRTVSNCDIYANNLIFDAISNGNIDIIKRIASIKEININQIMFNYFKVKTGIKFESSVSMFPLVTVLSWK